MTAFIVVVFAAFVLLFASLMGIVLGALSGWIVGLVFPDTIHLLAVMIGQPNMQPWEIGAILGFVGAFFRSTTTTKEK